MNSNNLEILLRYISRVYLRRRQAYFVGEGTNIWCNIHIQDLVQMYRCIISHALATAGASAKVDAYSNYYFAASSEHVMKDVVELIAAALHKRGIYL
jgi:NAD dependent epimerase/dehydratase family enzyme